MNLIRDLVDKLSRFFSKVLYEKELEYYMFTLFRNSEPEFILCIDSIASNYIYGKIVSSNKVSFINCYEATYMPYGLFIFARNTDEFVDKLVSKLNIVR